jgi:hypothetical protein
VNLPQQRVAVGAAARLEAHYDNFPSPGTAKDDLKYGVTLGYQF